MLIGGHAHRIAPGQNGFTLVEVLVALSTGMVIVFALFGLLQVATKQTRLITDKVQSDRLGREAMARVVGELHSACVARESVPVYSNSTESKLVFYNAYSEGAEVKTPGESKVATEGVYVHEITYEAGEKGTGKITEKVYPSTEVSFPGKVAYSTAEPPGKKILIAEHVTQAESKPVFEYFFYGKAASGEGTAAVSTLEPMKLKAGETVQTYEKSTGASAASVAAVQVNFELSPARYQESGYKETQFHLGIPLESKVTLALGAPNAETPIKDAPCD